jgi:hypothetical protein
MDQRSESVFRAKDLLDPRILVREGDLDALWDGVLWRRISPDEANALAQQFVPARGKNVRHDTIRRAREALDHWT